MSGSDDGTVRLWSIREEAPTAVIDAKANVCSVQFSPASPHLLAFGSANYRVYLYDLRQMRVSNSTITDGILHRRLGVCRKCCASPEASWPKGGVQVYWFEAAAVNWLSSAVIGGRWLQ